MFTLFSHNRTKYNSGQIFPFLIAIICMVLIMAMITVNLGQIALFRTDVSNAADAGALAGASVISGQFLSYGLSSDFMCGNSLVKTGAIIIAFTIVPFPADILTGLSLFMTSVSSNMTSFMKAMLDSQMAWTNARKTALQYAFNNVGVDEPRPTYEDFLDCKLAPCSDTRKAVPTTANYDEYLKGETQAARDFATNGFARFMEDDKNGWWVDAAFGSGEPMPNSPIPPAQVTNGYGWTYVPPTPTQTGRFVNSFENSGRTPKECVERKINGVDYPCWRDYDNFVEVKVKTARVIDVFKLVKLKDPSKLGMAVFTLVFFIKAIWLAGLLAALGPLGALLAIILAAIDAILAQTLVEAMDYGLDFQYGAGQTATTLDDYVNGSTIEATVGRYKAGSNVGLWNFRYAYRNPITGAPSPIQAMASARPFREKGNEIISPTFFEGKRWPLMLLLIGTASFGGLGLDWMMKHWSEYFDTQQHLFEVRLEAVR